jgi:hypothetical protein
MRVVYSSNNFIGSNLRLSRILEENYFDEIKILAYYNYSSKLHHIDWALDCLSPKPMNFFKDREAPRINKYYAELILDEITSFKPDMIISDLEPVSAYIAKLANIPLCYLSPLVALLDVNTYLPAYLKIFKQKILKYPRSNINIIYYPLKISSKYDNVIASPKYIDMVSSEDSDIKNKGLILSDLFNKNLIMNGGETDYISDAIYSNKNIYIIPKFRDLESMYNSYIIEKLNIGTKIGLLNSSNEYILSNLNKNNFDDTMCIDSRNLKQVLCL